MLSEFILDELKLSRSHLLELTQEQFNNGFLDGAVWPKGGLSLFLRTTASENLSYQSEDEYKIVLDRRWYEFIYLKSKILAEYREHKLKAEENDEIDADDYRDYLELNYSGLCIAYLVERLTCGSDIDVRKANKLIVLFDKELYYFREYQEAFLDRFYSGLDYVLKNILSLFGASHELGHVIENEDTNPQVLRIQGFLAATHRDLLDQLTDILKKKHHIKLESNLSIISHLLIHTSETYDEQVSVLVSMLSGIAEDASYKEVFADCVMAELICLNIIPLLDETCEDWDVEDIDMFLMTCVLQFVEMNNGLTGLTAESQSTDKDAEENVQIACDTQTLTTSRLNILQIFLETILDSMRNREHPSANIRVGMNRARSIFNSNLDGLVSAHEKVKRKRQINVELKAAEKDVFIPEDRAEKIEYMLKKTGYFTLTF
ncbi:hypothetical protein QX776_14495 [Alteromonadaceae bacterium BrNp21-10]|nr:hypothetical protein [Alteromonadaceae bacterium BrNp21-10]